MSDRIETRNRAMQHGMSAAEARKKREEVNVQIRKQKREEQLQKRRFEGAEPPSTSGGQAVVVPNSFNDLLEALGSDNPVVRLEATTQFRKLLSIERNPPIKQVIELGVVPKFIEFLKRDSEPHLQFEAAWALTNIASGTSQDTQVVISYGAVPIFVSLLQSPSIEVREQAVWALGNIAGDSPGCRDLVLSHNALFPLLHLLGEPAKISMLRNATWTVSNLCRGKPQPDFNLVRQALPSLSSLVYSNDDEVLTDACWALSYLSDGPNEKIQAVLDTGITPRLVELLLHPSPAVQTPALRAIGNIVTGDDGQTNSILHAGVLPCLVALLGHQKRGIRKEACWTISNITAGNKDQISAVVHAGIIPVLIGLLSNAEFEIRKEAAWAISNATSGGSPEDIAYLVSQGCIPPLCALLDVQEPKMLNVALEGLDNILRAGEDLKAQRNLDSNPYAEYVEAAGGLDKLEALQNHTNRDIYTKARQILETYCEAESEDDENIAPAVSSTGQFQFGQDMTHNSQGGFHFP
eukprot:c15526_g1_i1.p1 GENE.c15526_g1_i1~~c15526_g1_i1.p1  ORF type:complete len:522 (+),score=248.63 c15526_g1_i1:75-1640(+)